jgi:hypothetical protein
MGQSTDAYLFYGLDVLDHEVGMVPGVFDRDRENEDDGIGEYDLVAAFAESRGLQYGTHCSGGYPVHYLCTVEMMAYRGSPTRVHELPAVSPEDHAKLGAAAEDLGLDASSIGWWLASWWC